MAASREEDYLETSLLTGSRILSGFSPRYGNKKVPGCYVPDRQNGVLCCGETESSPELESCRGRRAVSILQSRKSVSCTEYR